MHMLIHVKGVLGMWRAAVLEGPQRVRLHLAGGEGKKSAIPPDGNSNIRMGLVAGMCPKAVVT